MPQPNSKHTRPHAQDKKRRASTTLNDKRSHAVGTRAERPKGFGTQKAPKNNFATLKALDPPKNTPKPKALVPQKGPPNKKCYPKAFGTPKRTTPKKCHIRKALLPQKQHPEAFATPKALVPQRGPPKKNVILLWYPKNNTSKPLGVGTPKRTTPKNKLCCPKGSKAFRTKAFRVAKALGQGCGIKGSSPLL